MSISSTSGISAISRLQNALNMAKGVERNERKSDAEAVARAAEAIEEPSAPRGDAKSPLPQRAASSDGRRYEVDRRTEESDSAKIIVVTYSDGSTESLSQIKGDRLIANVTEQLTDGMKKSAEQGSRPTSLNDKGLFISKLA